MTAPPRAAALITAALLAIVFAGCGDAYENGAGVYTTARTTSQATAPPATPAPTQSTDSSGTESSETAPLTSQQRRAARNASRAARRFLDGYLPYSYGKARADAIVAVAPALRSELARRPPRVPAALARRARPRLTRLQLSSASADAVYLLAHIDDASSRYVALINVQRVRSRWLVTRVQ